MDVRRVSRRIKTSTNYRQFASAGEEVSVRVDRLTLDRIADAVLVAEQFGREAAGYLAGRVTSPGKSSGERLRITVDAFLPVTAELMNGGFFDYNPAVRVRIDEQFRALAAKYVLVGFVRSSLRVGGLTAGDRALMGTNFGDAGIFLMVENPGNLCGTLYTPGAEGFASARPTYTFVFDSERDSSELRMIPGPVPAEARTRSAAGGLWKYAAVASVSAIVVLAIAFLAYQFRLVDLSSQRARYRDDGSSPLPVQLNAERTAGGNQWRISWNRASTTIRNADKARLIIQDGPLNKEVQLSDADLRIGSVIFSPLTDDVSLKLEVFDTARGRDISEGIRVLGTTYASASGVLEQTSGGPLRGLAAGLSSGDSGLNVVRQSRQSVASESKRESPEEGRPHARRVFTPSDSGLITVSRTRSDLPLPPDVQITGLSQASATTLDSFNPLQGPLPTVPHAESNSGTPGSALDRKPDTTGQAGATPTVESDSPAPRSSGVEPARLLSRVAPVYPKLPFPHGVPVRVQIEATIGEDGRVHDAKALAGPILFRQSALAAVSQWLYSPAKLRGQSIAMPTTIEVRFR
jgi:hypothetical protein